MTNTGDVTYLYIMKIYTHVSVAFAIIHFFAHVSRCEDLRNSEFLLPGNVIPTHYYVTLSFSDTCSDDISKFEFNKKFVGDVQIILMAVEPNVTVIELNCFGLEITGPVFITAAGLEKDWTCELKVCPCDDSTGKLTIYSPVILPMYRSLILWIPFAGKIGRSSKKGIFIASRVGKLEPSIGTLFQPAAARQAFPCFDEPKYKATFKLTLNVSNCILRKGYVALSNTPLEAVEARGDRSNLRFKTMNYVMSTYLFAFAITPFPSTPVKFFNSSYPNVCNTEWKELRTWAPRDVIRSWRGPLGQEVGARFLELFSRHLNMGYPLEKMDQVFNLIDVAPNGMENWGIISYSPRVRENSTFVNLLGHEIAHQWFGNLVTCRWWSELWLNEGFATYFSYYGMDKLKAENIISFSWNPLLLFIRKILLTALTADELSTSYPLTNPVENPSDYDLMFNVITYAKGGSVLRMWSHVLGEEAFMNGIKNYLNNNKFGLSTPELLLRAFDDVADESSSTFGKNLPSKYFRNWHTSAGFPLVEVKKCSKNASVYILTQRAFGKRESEKIKWTIPISYSTDVDKNFDQTHAMIWFNERNKEASIVLPSPVNWIIVNNQFTGFYRVKYERENYENLAQQLLSVEKHREIHEANRIQIVNDLFAIVKMCNNLTDEEYRFFMDLTLYLKHETSYLPWKSALDHIFDYLNTMLGKNDAIYRFFKVYVNDLLQDNYSKLTFVVKSSDSYNDRQLREELVKWACRMDHPDCVRQSYFFVNSFSLRSQLQNRLYDTALCTNIRRNMENDWSVLWRSYESTPGFEERSILLHAISCSTDSDILIRILMKSIDKNLMINEVERKSLFLAVLNSDPQNVGIALTFFAENYLCIQELYAGDNPVSELLLLLSRKLGTDEEVAEMKQIVRVLEEDDRVTVREIVTAEAMEICEINNNWIKTKSREVNVWLLSHYG